MDTLSFINYCFDRADIAPAAAIDGESESGDVVTEYARLLVTLYRCDVDYDIDIDSDKLTLSVPDPDGRLPDAYRSFRLTSLDWWDDFKTWFRAETAAIIQAATA